MTRSTKKIVSPVIEDNPPEVCQKQPAAAGKSADKPKSSKRLGSPEHPANALELMEAAQSLIDERCKTDKAFADFTSESIITAHQRWLREH